MTYLAVEPYMKITWFIPKSEKSCDVIIDDNVIIFTVIFDNK